MHVMQLLPIAGLSLCLRIHYGMDGMDGVDGVDGVEPDHPPVPPP